MDLRRSKIARIAVLGPGGVGGVISAVLVSKGLDVTCVAHEPTATLMQENGLFLDSAMFGQVHVFPKVVRSLIEPVDLLVVATKANHLEKALESIQRSSVESAFLLPVLNGVEHMAILRERLGGKVLAGSVRVESCISAPGRISHTSPFLIIKVASDNHNVRDSFASIASFLSSHGLETKMMNCESEVLWEKLARLAALACTTALTNRPLGFIREDPFWRSVLKDALREGVEVANKVGVLMSFEEQWAIVQSIPDSLTTSMQRDIAAGRPSELDAIAGALLREGHKQGVSCPVFEMLIDKIEGRIRNG